MALKLIGAVGIKVRPDAEHFRDEAERDIKRQMRDGVEVPAHVRPDMDRNDIKHSFDEHKRAMQRELDRISKDLELDAPRINSGDARNELRDLRSQARRTYRQMSQEVRNAAGVQRNLSREMDNEHQILRDIGDELGKQSSGSKGRGRILDLQNEINKSTSRQAQIIERANQAYDAEAQLRKSASQAAARDADREVAALGRIRSELERLEKGRQRRLGKEPALTEAERIAAQLRDNARVKIEVDAETHHAKKKVEHLKDYIDDLEANVHVGVDGEHAAAAQMAWVTRPRRAMIHAVVSKKSLAVAEGLLNSIAGVHALKSLGQGLEKIITDFDKFSLKAAGWTTLIGSMSNAVIAGATALFSLGDGLVRVVGIGAMAPTMLGAIGTSAIVATTALKDFFVALSSGDLSNLVGNARKEAEAVKGTWTELSNEIKENFWDNAGSNFSSFILGAMPTLKRGLGEVAAAMGKSWDNIFSALRHSTDMGYLDSMFDGLSEGLLNASNMMDPLVRGLMRLGARGSEYLPQFGNWLADIGEGFENWINKADQAGDINRWIEDGVQSIKDLGNVTKGTWNVLTGLSEAALAIGGPTLNDLASGMLKVGDAMHTAKGQFITREILGGAMEGWKLLASGMGEFFVAIGDNIGFVKDLEVSAGKLGGTLFRNLSEVLRNTDFTSGVVAGFDDINTAMVRLKPSFRNFGTLLGDMTRVSGAVFKGITPTINAATETISGFVHELSGPVIDLIPRLTAGMGAIINMVDTPIQGGGKLIGGIIDGFNQLPGPIQTAVLSLGGLMAMRPQIRGFGDAIMNRVVPATSKFGLQMNKLHAEHLNAGKNIAKTTAAYRTFRQEMALQNRYAGRTLTTFQQVNAALDSFAGNGARFYETGEGLRRMGTGLRSIGIGASAAMRSVGRIGPAIGSMTRATGVRAWQGLEAGARTLGDFGRTVSRSVPLISNQVRNLGRSMSQDFERGGAGFSRSLQTISRSFSDFRRTMQTSTFKPIRFSEMFRGLGPAAAQAKRGLAQIASGAGQAAAAIGMTAGAGLRRAASGLMGALGGPWGLAITGAAIGLGMLAQNSAESKQRIQNLQSTLTSAGKSTSDTHKAFQQLGGSFESLNRSATNASIPVETLNKAIEGDVEAKRDAIAQYDKYLEKQHEVTMSGQDQTGALIGQAAGQKRMKKALEEANEEYEKAVAKQQAIENYYNGVGEGIGRTGASAQKMTGALQTLEQEMSMASVTGETLFASVDTVTNGLVAGQDAAYNYQNSIAGMKEALNGWTDSYGEGIKGISKTLEKNNGMLDMTKQSHRELYSILRGQIEPAYQQVADAFNRAGGGEKGREAARKSMSGIRDDWMSMLTDQVGMTDEAASNMLDSLNINPDAIEMILDDGDVNSKLDEIANSLKIISGEKTIAQVEAEVKGKAEVDSFKRVITAFGDTKAEAKLSANDQDLLAKLRTADGKLKIFETQKYLARLAAQDDVSGTVAAVRAALEVGFVNKTYTATLEALDNASGLAQGVRDKIMAAVVNQDFEAAIKLAKDANIDGDLDGLIQKLQELDAQSATPGINEPQGAAAAQGVITNLGLDLGDLDGTTAMPTLGVYDDASGPIADVKGNAEGYDGSEYAGMLVLQDLATDQIYYVRDLLDAIAGQDHSIPVRANTNYAMSSLAMLNSILASFMGRQYMVTVQANTTPAVAQVAGLHSILSSFVGSTYMATISANTTPAVAAAAGLHGILSSITNRTYMATMSANTTPAVAAAAGLHSILSSVARGNYTATLRANAGPAIAGANQALSHLNRVAAGRYQARITANASGAVQAANQARSALLRVANGRYYARITGDANGVTRAAHWAIQALASVPRSKHSYIQARTYGLGGVYSLIGAIASVHSKTVFVRVHTYRTGSSAAYANGGIVEQFADGGFSGVRKGGLQNPLRNPAIRTIENHTAQIAPGGSMRVWAEPETGGEAYIPLAKTKRTRSEAILGQVADRFGMSLERNAEGSGSGRTSGSDTAPSTQSGDTYNINVEAVPTNHADEVSSAVMFDLKHMKRGGYAGAPR